MSQVPTSFNLGVYQAMVSDAIGEPVRLLVLDEQRLLLPASDELDDVEQGRTAAILQGDKPAAGLFFERQMDAARSTSLRLVALVAQSQKNPAEALSARLRETMVNVGGCVNDAWILSCELDEMTDELTARYEELHLLYQIDRQESVDGNDSRASLTRLLENTGSHLQVCALIVFVPDDDLELSIEIGGSSLESDPVVADVLAGEHVQSLRSVKEQLCTMTHSHEGAIVLNRADDSRRTDLFRAFDSRIMIAPLRIGGSNGIVAVSRPLASPEFRTHDSKLITVLADQLTTLLRRSRDELTGLLNREGFEKRLAKFTTSDARSGGLLLYFDLNNFRVLNETCGRLAGDEVLRQSAEILDSATRGKDVVARIGGDEFAILIGDCESGLAPIVANKFLAHLRQHEFIWAGTAQEIAVNVGVVHLAKHDGDSVELLLAAQMACDQAIIAGANSLHVYSTEDELFIEQLGRVQWVPKIREALAEDRFELHAQVITPIRTAEALPLHQEILVRLRDEQGRLISPGEFIPAAERFQLMPDVDRWVVRRALATLGSRHWRDAASGVVWSINLSGQSLSDERFRAFLLEELKLCSFPLKNLCFEVTETAAVANHRAAVTLITELQSLGVSFALDDFGTGLSSFAYLKNLPVNMLKIDGYFVKSLVSDPFCRATVDAVNRVGKAMGLSTVAEYVENDAILQVLNELGVDYAQGFGIGRPVALEQTLQGLRQSMHGSPIPRSAQVIDLADKRLAHE